MHETQSRPADSWEFTPANTAVVVSICQNILGASARHSLSAELGRYCSEDPELRSMILEGLLIPKNVKEKLRPMLAPVS
jgi:hypothetical protein